MVDRACPARRTTRRRGSRRARTGGARAGRGASATARSASGPRARPRSSVEVVGTAGDRSEHVDVGVGRPAADVIEVAALGHDAVARLEPEHAAAVRRDAHRAADVGAELEAGEARRDRGGRSAGRPAGDAFEVPRVVRRAEDLVVGLEVARTSGARSSCRTRSRRRPSAARPTGRPRPGRGPSARPRRRSSGCRRPRSRP